MTKEIIAQLVAALEAARHGLIISNSLRATDLAEEIFEAHLDNGIPRENLEWVTDNSKEIDAIDAALAAAKSATQGHPPARFIQGWFNDEYEKKLAEEAKSAQEPTAPKGTE
jgi:hypothetical protein